MLGLVGMAETSVAIVAISTLTLMTREFGEGLTGVW